MLQAIDALLLEISEYSAKNIEEVEQFRLKYLSKKGVVSKLFESFKEVPNDQKKEFGQKLNLLKNAAQEKLDSFQLLSIESDDEFSKIDIS